MSREPRVAARQAEAVALPTGAVVPQYPSKSREGLVTATRVSHSPEITSQVRSAKEGLRSSGEVQPAGWDQEGTWPGMGTC